MMPVASFIALMIDGANHRVERRLSEWHVAGVTLIAGVMLMSEATLIQEPSRSIVPSLSDHATVAHRG